MPETVGSARVPPAVRTLRCLEDSVISSSAAERRAGGAVGDTSVPPRVEYRLTELGESLLPVLAVVTAWAERHISDIDAARAGYDSITSR